MHFFEFKVDSNNRVASIVLYTTVRVWLRVSVRVWLRVSVRVWLRVSVRVWVRVKVGACCNIVQELIRANIQVLDNNHWPPVHLFLSLISHVLFRCLLIEDLYICS